MHSLQNTLQKLYLTPCDDGVRATVTSQLYHCLHSKVHAWKDKDSLGAASRPGAVASVKRQQLSFGRLLLKVGGRARAGNTDRTGGCQD